MGKGYQSIICLLHFKEWENINVLAQNIVWFSVALVGNILVAKRYTNKGEVGGEMQSGQGYHTREVGEELGESISPLRLSKQETQTMSTNTTYYNREFSSLKGLFPAFILLRIREGPSWDAFSIPIPHLDSDVSYQIIVQATTLAPVSQGYSQSPLL